MTASLRRLSLTVLGPAVVLLGVPMSGLPGNTPFVPLSIVVQVSPSASITVQNVEPSGLQIPADRGPRGLTPAMSDAPPVLVLNTGLVAPDVMVEIPGDVASRLTSTQADSADFEEAAKDGIKLVSLKDLGLAPAPSLKRLQESDLKETFERAASQLIYRLDLLNNVKADRQKPVVISINL